MNRFLIAFLLLLAASEDSLTAQETPGAVTHAHSPSMEQAAAGRERAKGQTFLMAGYANVQYTDPEEGTSSFGALFAPILVFRTDEHLLFQAELEFLQDGQTVLTELMFAEMDYTLGENAILIAGKFLLPLGMFGERSHPSWINKLPTPPIIYSGHGGTEAGIIPTMSDFGVQFRGGFLTGGMRWTYAAYFVNGPRAAAEGEGHGAAETGEGEHAGGTTVSYEGASPDDNDNKALGVRLGLLPLPSLEFGISYYTGDVTYRKFEGEALPPGKEKDGPIRLTMIDFAYQYLPLQLRGEYLIEDGSALDDYVRGEENGTTEGHSVPSERSGYWVEISYAFGGVLPELVLRYGSSATDGKEIGTQAALGLDWWLDPSLVVKVAAVMNTAKNGETETTTDSYVAMAKGF